MKRYMPEMTNLQVREYMEGGGRTVLVPVGSTEDHGDHGPLWTDVYIPLEVCKRAAEELEEQPQAVNELGLLRRQPTFIHKGLHPGVVVRDLEQLAVAVKELAALPGGSRAIVSICADGGQGTVALLEN